MASIRIHFTDENIAGLESLADFQRDAINFYKVLPSAMPQEMHPFGCMRVGGQMVARTALGEYVALCLGLHR